MADISHDEFQSDLISPAVEYIKSRVQFTPKILIICGSGLSAVADILQEPIIFKYEDIPNFPEVTVDGHVGELVFGSLSDNKVMCMKGRSHFYEGHCLRKVTLPVRIAKILGVELLIVTNAAGGINKKYKAGDIMVIKDHLNIPGMAGHNPLRGPNDDYFGERFVAMNRAYDQELIVRARQIAKQVGLASSCHEGVYAMVTGPNYESIAEVLALRTLGVDAVGMSTVPEVLVAKHCGMKVFGLSIISNETVDDYSVRREPSHREVQKVVSGQSEKIKHFLIKLIETCKFHCKCKY